jgi:hypothetical protein
MMGTAAAAASVGVDNNNNADPGDNDDRLVRTAYVQVRVRRKMMFGMCIK